MAGTYRKTSKAKSADVGTLNVSFTDEDAQAWTAAVKTARVSGVEKIPAGWYTMLDIATMFGVSESGACHIIKRLRSTGKVETRKFLIERATRTYPVPHFKLLK